MFGQFGRWDIDGAKERLFLSQKDAFCLLARPWRLILQFTPISSHCTPTDFNHVHARALADKEPRTWGGVFLLRESCPLKSKKERFEQEETLSCHRRLVGWAVCSMLLNGRQPARPFESRPPPS